MDLSLTNLANARNSFDTNVNNTIHSGMTTLFGQNTTSKIENIGSGLGTIATDLNPVTGAFGKLLNPSNSSGTSWKNSTAAQIGTGAIEGIASIFGMGGVAKSAFGAFGIGDCGILCQIKKWLNKSQFFQRAALIVLAFIIIGSAFYLFRNQGTSK